jgi:hypothetical protein
MIDLTISHSALSEFFVVNFFTTKITKVKH